jgi:hypothetical protein
VHRYTITASCASGCGDQNGTLNPITLSRVVFGDVYFCSGQSNMALSLHYTYSAAELTKKVASGGYSNIRVFMYGGMSVSAEYQKDEPTYSTPAYDSPWCVMNAPSQPFVVCSLFGGFFFVCV